MNEQDSHRSLDHSHSYDVSDHSRKHQHTGPDILRYIKLYEFSPDMHVSVDPETANVLACNQTLADRLRSTKDEIIGGSIFNLYPPEYQTEARKVFDRFQASGSIKDAELALMTRKGERIPVMLNVEAIRDEHGKILYSNSIWRDITIRKQWQEKLKTANQELEEKVRLRTQELSRRNKELEQFAYVASHDLREPIRSLNGFAKLLERKLEDFLDEDSQSYLDYIKQASSRMSTLVTGLLDHATIGKNKEIETVDLDLMMKAVEDDLNLQIDNSKAELSFSNMPVLQGYRTELRLLFQNLISNGIKFKAENRTPIVRVSAMKEDQGWLFTVSDNGIGISGEYLDKIFAIFQRLHPKDEYQGTGIGLAHCKKIVELHQGEIWVESTEGEGSSFHFTIPDHLESLSS